MGEIAEGILDGTFCQECGELMIDEGEDPPGHTQSCAGCLEVDDEDWDDEEDW